MKGPTAGICLAAALLAAGCQEQLGPQQVAERFWSAVAARDAAAARALVTAASRDAVALDGEVLPVGDVELGRIVIEGDTARIDTAATVLGDEPLRVPLVTHLQREGERWRVDYRRTVEVLSNDSDIGRAIAKLRELNNRLAAGLDQSMAELEKRLPEIEREARRFKQELAEKLPGMRAELEALAKRLQQALEEALRPLAPQAPPEEQPKAI